MRDRTPEKKQSECYSGKQKCHTIKDLVVTNGQSGEILFVSEAKGAVHDFEMYKQSGIRLHEDTLFVGDSGFQGICDIHAFSATPFKKPKGGELTEEQKEFNRSLAQYRIRIEHVNRRIKCFKIFQHRYRNKQQKHLIRFRLICGIYNYQLRL